MQDESSRNTIIFLVCAVILFFMFVRGSGPYRLNAGGLAVRLTRKP